MRNARIGQLEAAIFHHFHGQMALMNGSVPIRPGTAVEIPEASDIIQVMSDEEIARRKEPAARLPRQIEHYGRLVDHYLTVKNSPELRLSMEAHFERLCRYHARFLEQIGPGPQGSEDAKTA